MSTKREREFIVEKIRELASKGYTQRSIANTLQISLGSVNKRIQQLRQQSKHNITKYIEEDLPLEYSHTLTGLNQILQQAWQTADTTKGKDRFMNLTLAKECYAMKIELLSSATIVDRAVQFVARHKPEYRELTTEEREAVLKNEQRRRQREQQREQLQQQQQSQAQQAVATEDTNRHYQ